MFERGEWLRIWIVLTVTWTIVVATSGWINLPRAQHIPHDPDFLNRLSNEAALILIGRESKAEPPHWGALIWSDAPISVPMLNGTRLTFPATTTNAGVELVRSEYSKLLEAEAGIQRRIYALEMLITWLLPCPILLVLGMAADLIWCVYQRAAQDGTPESVAAEWAQTHKKDRPSRVDNASGYQPEWEWGVADGHAEQGF